MSAIDVVVPCYNYGRFLEGCVNSVLSQRDVDVRVLIIDDASCDESALIGERLAREHSRVTFCRHEKNMGHIQTFNEGIIEWAAAPYSLLLSADDALTAGSLGRAAAVLDKHSDVGLVYGRALVISNDDHPLDRTDVALPTYQIVSGARFLRRCCSGGNPIPSPCAVVRTELQHSLGGYCPRMLHTSDLEMWMRFATGGPIGVILQHQAYYRSHGANMHVKYVSGALGDRRQRFETCQYVFEMWGGAKIPGFERSLEDMKMVLGREAYWLAGQAFERGDLVGYRSCVVFADEIAPSLQHSAGFWRLRAKRLLGARFIRGMRLAMGNTREILGTTAQPSQLKEFGWWPDLANS